MSKEFRLHVSDPWYMLIKEGVKTVEGRQKGGEVGKMSVGDTIIFFNENHGEFSVEVTRVTYYDTLKSYVETEGPSKVTPGFDTVEEACQIYYRYYTDESIRAAEGMVAIEMKVKI